jgi:hypothetical protein
MTILGDKNTFAIEAIIEPGLKAPSPIWGRMCVWCNGTTIGNLDEKHCGLEAFSNFSDKIKQIDGLWMSEFDGLSDHELWNYLDGLLYGYHGDIELEDNRTLDQMRLDAKKYGKFNFLTNWGEMFDNDGKSFIFHHPEGKIKILNRQLNSKNIISFSTTIYAFCHAIEEGMSWYHEQAAILQSFRSA